MGIDQIRFLVIELELKTVHFDFVVDFVSFATDYVEIQKQARLLELPRTNYQKLITVVGPKFPYLNDSLISKIFTEFVQKPRKFLKKATFYSNYNSW